MSRAIPMMVYVGTYVPTGSSHPRQVSSSWSMLLVLSYFAPVVAFPQLLVGLRILFSYSCDVSLNGVWSNNLRSSTNPAANISGLAVGILGIESNEISCPLLVFVLVVPSRWSLLPPLRCWSVLVWEVVCVPFLLG